MVDSFVAIDLDSLWQQAVRRHQSGDIEGAMVDYDQLLGESPQHAGALFLSAQILTAHQPVESKNRFQRAVAVAPQWLDPRLSLIRLALDWRHLDAARAELVAAHPMGQADIRYLRLVADVAQAQGRVAERLAARQAACALPNALSDDWFNLGAAAQGVFRDTEAEQSYRRALAMSPGDVASNLNLAALLQRNDRFAEAMSLYDQVPVPRQGAFRAQIIECMRKAGRFEAWSAAIESLDTTSVDAATALRLQLERAQWVGDFDVVARLISVDLDRLLEGAPSEINAIAAALREGLEELLFLILYFDVDAHRLSKLFALYNHLSPQSSSELSPRPRSAGRRLRVGYVSADLRQHVMGRMAEVMLAHRDSAHHEAYLYSTGSKEDDLTARLEAVSTGFVRAAKLNDEQLVSRIRADGIDVLVDLSTHTEGARPQLFALRAAPIQITHIAMAGPLGLRSVNFKLSDPVCDLPASQALMQEQLLAMQGCCYPVPNYSKPAPSLDKAALGLQGKVTLGAFFTHLKLSARCLALWKRVLDAIPNGVLVFSPLDPALKQAYTSLCASAGIGQERFVFIDAKGADADRLARYSVIDFVLDSAPYGGVNGTLEALYCGVPVVTLLGEKHSERTSASILNYLGEARLIAKTPDDYVALATRLANEPHWRADLTRAIKDKWLAFADPVDYARRWERVLDRAIELSNAPN